MGSPTENRQNPSKRELLTVAEKEDGIVYNNWIERIAMVRLVDITEKDYAPLARFLANFGESAETEALWLDRFRFWWDDNPAATEGVARGWILEDDSRIEGFFGIIPTRFQLLGKHTTAHNATTWRVSDAYRHSSMKLLFRAIKETGEGILFNNTPIEQVVPILKSLRFRPLPRESEAGDRLPCGVVVLDFKKAAELRAGRGFAGQAGALLGAPLFALYQRFRLRNLKMNGLEVRLLDQAGVEFDRFWEETRPVYANTSVRSAEALQWYCFRATPEEMKLFGCYREGRLAGYLIAWRRIDRNSSKLECVDLWTRPGDDEATSALLAGTIRYAKSEAADLALFPHFSGALGKTLLRLGLFRVSTRRRGEYFKTTDEIAGRIDHRNSYFVDTQGDRSFFP